MKLNQYKQCNTCRPLCFKKHLHISFWLITKSTKFQTLGLRRAIVLVPLNTDLAWVQLKPDWYCRLKFSGSTDIKMLENTFGEIPFQFLKTSLAKICKLRVWIETDQSLQKTLRKKCPYSELFWSTFSRTRNEYGEIWSISPYSVQMRENSDQNNSEYGRFSRSEKHRKDKCFSLQMIRNLLWSLNVLLLRVLLWHNHTNGQ